MILKTKKQNDYELVDSGNGEKLERYGSYTLRRPDPEAIWEKSKDIEVWEKAGLKFVRTGTKTKWIVKEGTSKSWNISYGDLNFSIRPTSFKHTGLFPEQLPNWQWTEKIITNYQLQITNKKVSVLNLFAYTGGATLACAKAGAEVCHVDGSKTAVEWARENAKLSELEDAPVRWIVEDVLVFLKREIKRGRKYDAIIMDPPSFGHGPDGEMWKIEDDFVVFVDECKKLLSDRPLFFLISGYAAGYSSTAYRQNISDLLSKFGGTLEDGELGIEEKGTGRILPCGIFARWSR